MQFTAIHLEKFKKEAKTVKKTLEISHREALAFIAKREGYESWYHLLKGEKTLKKQTSQILGIFNSQTQFYKTEFSEEAFLRLTKTFNNDIFINFFLKHSSCPLSYKVEKAMHHVWYIRLTAMCAKSTRSHFFDQALKDSKSTVRAAALKGAFFDKRIDSKELLEYIKKDPFVANYFYWLSELEPEVLEVRETLRNIKARTTKAI